MKRSTLSGAVLLAVAGWAATALAQEPAAKPPVAEPIVHWETNVCVYVQGEWTLRVEYLQIGTRSEGQVGVLLKAGQPVQPATEAEEVDTALGRLKHYGTERKVLWSNTGWNFADRKLIKLSGQVKPPPPPRPAAR